MVKPDVELRAALALAACLAFAGCESPAWIRNLNDSFYSSRSGTPEEEERHRTAYLESGDRASMRWLLSHRIEAGMNYDAVCKVLGVQGSPERNDRAIKTGGGNYQLGDEIYSFGPDSQGSSVYLAFREGRLVNFDPSQFRSGSAE